MSTILALDQASRVSGWSIFKDNKLYEYGKIQLEDDDIGDRLYKLRTEIIKLIEKYEVTEVVFEDIQLQGNVTNNVQTFKVLAEVFGIVYELVTELNLPNEQMLASTWKSALGIGGRSRAEQKQGAQNYITTKYSIKVIQDVADSICIGEAYILSKKDKKPDFDWS